MNERNRVILLLVLIITPVVIAAAYSVGNSDGLKRFTSYSELQSFVTSGLQSSSGFRGNGFYPPTAGPVMAAINAGAQAHSVTNIQVSDVDEADTVKNDGEFIYTVSDNHVFVVKAYPVSEAKVVSNLSFTGTIEGLYLQGSRLVVLWQNSSAFPCEACPILQTKTTIMPIYYGASKSIVQVYDVSKQASPVLKQTVSVDGGFFLGSRMIGDYVYLVASHFVWYGQGEVALPQVSIDGRSMEIAPTDIYYSPQKDFSFSYTLIVALNVQDEYANPSIQTFLLGASGTLYVSASNLYLTMPDYSYYYEGNTPRTIIHRIQLNGLNVEYMATGSVPGFLLNQFSMDEYEGFLRVATTIPAMSLVARPLVSSQSAAASLATTAGNSTNNVYVLDMHLTRVSALEGLAQGESIYSSRFLGTRAYLETFKKIDPLFVLDLSNPFAPQVLGELKMTGYSNYLQLVDQTHLIGIGKEAADSGYASFAWYQGIKIALFDVSDVSHPTVLANYTIGDRGTDSPVLQDHHALLFDPTRNLLVIPVHLAMIDPTQYGGSPPPYAYGQYVWQGAYVFTVSPTQGITLQGRITHLPGGNETTNWYNNYPYYITRSLYIGDTLYTISQNMIQMHSLDGLALQGSITFPVSN